MDHLIPSIINYATILSYNITSIYGFGIHFFQNLYISNCLFTHNIMNFEKNRIILHNLEICRNSITHEFLQIDILISN